MPQQISIVIPAFNQLDYCKQCIETVLAYTHPPYQLILVDNGSTDGVSELFDGVRGARVIHSERNLGFAGGVNLGLRIAEGHVLLLNSDTLVPEGWLEPLERALLSADDIGMAGPMSNYVSGPQQIAGLLFESQDETEELSSEVVQLLLYDVSTSDNFKAGDELLKDISDEEAVYLRTSLKAGDLL